MYLKPSIFHSKNEYLNLTCQPHTAKVLRMPVFSGYFGISGTRQKWCKNLNLTRLPVPPYPHIWLCCRAVHQSALSIIAKWSGNVKSFLQKSFSFLQKAEARRPMRETKRNILCDYRGKSLRHSPKKSGGRVVFCAWLCYNAFTC